MIDPSIETSIYLSGFLVLSLVLPVLVSLKAPQESERKRACLKVVMAGQISLAICGLAVLARVGLAPYIAMMALASCSLFGVKLVRVCGVASKGA